MAEEIEDRQQFLRDVNNDEIMVGENNSFKLASRVTEAGMLGSLLLVNVVLTGYDLICR